MPQYISHDMSLSKRKFSFLPDDVETKHGVANYWIVLYLCLRTIFTVSNTIGIQHHIGRNFVVAERLTTINNEIVCV